MTLDDILRRFESLAGLVRSVIDRSRHQSMMLEVVEEQVVGLPSLELPFCHMNLVPYLQLNFLLFNCAFQLLNCFSKPFFSTCMTQSQRFHA